MSRRHAFAVACLLAWPLLGLAAACTHDFDAFVVAPDDAASEGGRGSDGGATDGGGACGAPQDCLVEAGNCVIDCDKARDQCLSKCNNNGCRQQCQNASTQCRGGCAAGCTSCATAAGCSGSAECSAATK